MKIAIRTTPAFRHLALGVAVAVLALSTTACTAASGSFSRTLNVNGPVILTVDTASGHIHVLPGGSSQVIILGHVNSGGWGIESPQSRVNQIVRHPPIEQSGNVINIGRHMNLNNVSINYDITVPEGTQIEASTASGGIRVDNLEGALRASSASGSIWASGLHGNVSLRDVSGDIEASFDQSSDVRAHNVSGNIRLKNVHDLLYAKTVSGNIEISGTPGQDWGLDSVSGSISLHTGGAGYDLDATSVSGNLHCDAAPTTRGTVGGSIQAEIHGGGPQVHARTISGNIRIH